MEGTQIGPYRVLGDLGSGGMGNVYLAEVAGKTPGLDVGIKVALKVIHPHLLETPGFFKRFLREAEIGKSVEQDNVVRCFDCDALMIEGHQQNFLVMEYVEGQTLRELLNELERVPEELCRHIGREIAKGLVAIHEAGVIHRDLKPENVLITEEHVVKVMDLGVARLQDEAIRLSQTGAFVGSLEYASPEQFRGGGEDVDARSDLHALGVMLYELWTGQHPYRTGDVSSTLKNVIDGVARRAGEVNPQLSPFFEEMVHTLAAKEPDDRFASASTLLAALEEGEKSEWWRERAKALWIQTKRPLRRIHIPRETALYGRDDDLAKLHTLYEKAKAGDGQVLLIEGEAGIGKTRLVDAFVGRLRQEGEDINFLFGSYPPGGAATVSGAFSTAYREQFGAEGLADTLKEYLTVTPVLIPSFAALLRGETTPTGAEPLTKDSLQTVFTHATRALAAERTTIVLIDDLHFAPEEGRALFSSLAMAVPGHRILLLGTMRPGVPADWTANVIRLEQAEQRSLARLGPKDLADLLGDAFRSKHLAEELAYQIGVKSDGNPFFAFEIIRGLREGQFISQQPDGTWVTTKVIQDIKIPSSVLDLVNARVADLSEEERDLLDVASCCGFTFDPVLVASTLGLGQVPALRRLARIEKEHRLVRSAGAKYSFDHHQVQEALYEGLHERLRQLYHVAIAVALEADEGVADREPKEIDGALCVDLCEHFLKGASGERALRYIKAALDHLGRGYLNDQAIALADRTLDVPGLLIGTSRLSVLLQKNGRLDLLGRRTAQEVVLAEARSLAEASGEKKLVAEVEHATGTVCYSLGRYDHAQDHYERHLAIAREIGDRRGESAATGNLGHVLFSLGRHEEAREHYARSLAIAREVGDRMTDARSTGALGNVLFSLGRYEEAREHNEKHLAIARDIGDRRGEAIATGNLGNVFFSLGRCREAKEHVEHCLAIARKIGDRRVEAWATGILGNVLFSLGRDEDAKGLHERHLAITREIGDRRGEALARRGLGAVAERGGHGDMALSLYEEALILLRRLDLQSGIAEILVSVSRLHEVSGRTGRSQAYLEEALALGIEFDVPGAVVLADCHLAILHDADATEALSAFDEYKDRLACAAKMESRFILWQATHDCAHLQEANRLLDHFVEHAPEEYRESMLKNVRLHREIMEAWEEHWGEGK